MVVATQQRGQPCGNSHISPEYECRKGQSRLPEGATRTERTLANYIDFKVGDHAVSVGFHLGEKPNSKEITFAINRQTREDSTRLTDREKGEAAVKVMRAIRYEVANHMAEGTQVEALAVMDDGGGFKRALAYEALGGMTRPMMASPGEPQYAKVAGGRLVPDLKALKEAEGSGGRAYDRRWEEAKAVLRPLSRDNEIMVTSDRQGLSYVYRPKPTTSEPSTGSIMELITGIPSQDRPWSEPQMLGEAEPSTIKRRDTRNVPAELAREAPGRGWLDILPRIAMDADGQPCGNSYISPDYECRVGEGSGVPDDMIPGSRNHVRWMLDQIAGGNELKGESLAIAKKGGLLLPDHIKWSGGVYEDSHYQALIGEKIGGKVIDVFIQGSEHRYVTFKAGGDYDTAVDLSPEQSTQAALAIMQAMKHDAMIQGQNVTYRCTAYDSDGRGFERAIAYSRLAGFSRPVGLELGESQFGITVTDPDGVTRIKPDLKALREAEAEAGIYGSRLREPDEPNMPEPDYDNPPQEPNEPSPPEPLAYQPLDVSLPEQPTLSLGDPDYERAMGEYGETLARTKETAARPNEQERNRFVQGTEEYEENLEIHEGELDDYRYAQREYDEASNEWEYYREQLSEYEYELENEGPPVALEEMNAAWDFISSRFRKAISAVDRTDWRGKQSGIGIEREDGGFSILVSHAPSDDGWTSGQSFYFDYNDLGIGDNDRDMIAAMPKVSKRRGDSLFLDRKSFSPRLRGYLSIHLDREGQACGNSWISSEYECRVGRHGQLEIDYGIRQGLPAGVDEPGDRVHRAWIIEQVDQGKPLADINLEIAQQHNLVRPEGVTVDGTPGYQADYEFEVEGKTVSLSTSGGGVSFSVDGRMGSPPEMTPEGSAIAAKKVMACINYEVAHAEDGEQYECEAVTGDGRGFNRAIAYEMAGFSRPAGGEPGGEQYGIVAELYDGRRVLQADDSALGDEEWSYIRDEMMPEEPSLPDNRFIEAYSSEEVYLSDEPEEPEEPEMELPDEPEEPDAEEDSPEWEAYLEEKDEYDSAVVDYEDAMLVYHDQMENYNDEHSDWEDASSEYEDWQSEYSDYKDAVEALEYGDFGDTITNRWDYLTGTVRKALRGREWGGEVRLSQTPSSYKVFMEGVGDFSIESHNIDSSTLPPRMKEKIDALPRRARRRDSLLSRADDAGQPCGNTYISPEFECRVGMGAKAKHFAIHEGDELGRNVTAWGVGKVVGGAVAGYAIAHGAAPIAAGIIIQAATQAGAATALHAVQEKRKGNDLNGKKLLKYYAAQISGAYLGKYAHYGTEKAMELFGQAGLSAAIATMASGKITGLTTTVAANKALKVDTATDPIVYLFLSEAPENPPEAVQARLWEAFLEGIAIALQEPRSDSFWGSLVPSRGHLSTHLDKDGQTCGKGWISPSYECRVGQGDSPESVRDRVNVIKAQKDSGQKLEGDDLTFARRVGLELPEGMVVAVKNTPSGAVSRSIYSFTVGSREVDVKIQKDIGTAARGVDFEIDGDYEDRGELSGVEGRQVIKGVLQAVRHDLQQQPPGTRYECGSFMDDERGLDRAVAYEKLMGFSRPLAGTPGFTQYGALAAGEDGINRLQPDAELLKKKEESSFTLTGGTSFERPEPPEEPEEDSDPYQQFLNERDYYTESKAYRAELREWEEKVERTPSLASEDYDDRWQSIRGIQKELRGKRYTISVVSHLENFVVSVTNPLDTVKRKLLHPSPGSGEAVPYDLEEFAETLPSKRDRERTDARNVPAELAWEAPGRGWLDILPRVRKDADGQPCGNSYISPNYECRVGGGKKAPELPEGYSRNVSIEPGGFTTYESNVDGERVSLYIKNGNREGSPKSVSFTIDGLHRMGSTLSNSARAKVAINLMRCIAYDVAQNPPGTTYECSAVIDDGRGMDRAIAYEIAGFTRPISGDPGDSQFGISVADENGIPRLTPDVALLTETEASAGIYPGIEADEGESPREVLDRAWQFQTKTLRRATKSKDRRASYSNTRANGSVYFTTEMPYDGAMISRQEIKDGVIRPDIQAMIDRLPPRQTGRQDADGQPCGRSHISSAYECRVGQGKQPTLPEGTDVVSCTPP